MNNDPLILAVDLGTSGVKVALIDVQGRIHGWQSKTVPLTVIPHGGAEQSPDDWWDAFIQASGNLLDKTPQARSRIVAVGCSTQGEGTIPVDRKGQALCNAILWMDMRGAASLRKQLAGWINIEGAGISKLLRFIRLTGGAPSFTGKDPAGHILWLRDHQPEIYRRTYKFLNVLDYMNLRLTGQFVASYDSIVTTWVTDNRNPNRLAYSDRLISLLGIDLNQLPEIAPCADIIGSVLPEVSDQLGLPRGVKVVAGAIDSTAAAIGSGAVEDYVPHLYIGTSSWIAAHVPFKKTSLRHRLASIPCALPDRYLLIALQATAGGNLTFLRDNIIYHKDELLQAAEQPDIFQFLDQIAARVAPGAGGLIYTPWIWGERAPVDDRHVRAGLFNLSLSTNREDIIRAFLEGVAMNNRWLLTPVRKFLGRDVSNIHLVGGGAQSDVWCQIFADVLNVPIKQIAEPIAANARGAAWIAAVGLGMLSFSDIPDLIRVRSTYEPDPKCRRIYDDRFAIFTDIYARTKRIYRKLNAD